MMRLLITLLISFFTLSCHRNPNSAVYYQKENASEFTKRADLRFDGTLEIPVDNETTSAMTGIDVFEDKHDKKDYISFLNPTAKAILIFDLSTHSLVKKVPLYQDGPNDSGPITNPSMHKMLSMDSILYFNYDNLYLLTGAGQIRKKINIVSDAAKGIQQKPNPGTFSPMITQGTNIYLICSYNSSFKPQSALDDLIKIDLQTGKKSAHFKRSQIYDFGFWGYNLNLYYLYGVHNNKRNQIILSYAADPYLYSYDLKTDSQKKEAFVGSENFKEIEPYLQDRAEMKVDVNPEIMAQSAEHELTNPSYYGLLYDEKTSTYIRSTFLPKTKEEYRNPIKRFKFMCSLILFDENYQKIGESILPDASILDYRMMFVRNGKLYIFNKEKYNLDNNKLFFDTYAIVLKNNP